MDAYADGTWQLKMEIAVLLELHCQESISPGENYTVPGRLPLPLRGKCSFFIQQGSAW